MGRVIEAVKADTALQIALVALLFVLLISWA